MVVCWGVVPFKNVVVGADIGILDIVYYGEVRKQLRYSGHLEQLAKVEANEFHPA